MSKQRTEPSDPAAELANYDFSNSEGSSADNSGTMKTDTWPEELDREDVTDTGQEIIERWVNSQYNTLTQANLRNFHKENDYGKSTVRTWIYRAYPSQRDYEDLTEGEKKAALIHAAYGEEYNFKELIDNFEITDPDLTFARHGVPDIVDELRNRHTETKLRKEAQRFMVTDELPTVETQENEKLDANAYDEYYNYFVDNPNADVDTARDDVGIEATNAQIGRVKGSATLHMKSQNQQADTNDDAEQNDDNLTIEINVPRERAREIVVSQSLPGTVREQVVNNILDSVGL